MVSFFYDLSCDCDKKVCASLTSFPKCSKRSVKFQNKMQDCQRILLQVLVLVRTSNCSKRGLNTANRPNRQTRKKDILPCCLCSLCDFAFDPSTLFWLFFLRELLCFCTQTTLVPCLRHPCESSCETFSSKTYAFPSPRNVTDQEMSQQGWQKLK